MKKGFSLIELMVVTAIIAVLLGGTIIYFNQSKSVQKLGATKSELTASLRMARNYARTLQVPVGFVGNLVYVGVSLSTGGVMRIYPASSGGESPLSYFSRDISPDGVNISVNPSEIFFAAYDGKLLKNDGGIVPRGAGEVVTIVISSSEGIGSTESVRINAMGLVDE